MANNRKIIAYLNQIDKAMEGIRQELAQKPKPLNTKDEGYKHMANVQNIYFIPTKGYTRKDLVERIKVNYKCGTTMVEKRGGIIHQLLDLNYIIKIGSLYYMNKEIIAD